MLLSAPDRQGWRGNTSAWVRRARAMTGERSGGDRLPFVRCNGPLMMPTQTPCDAWHLRSGGHTHCRGVHSCLQSTTGGCFGLRWRARCPHRGRPRVRGSRPLRQWGRFSAIWQDVRHVVIRACVNHATVQRRPGLDPLPIESGKRLCTHRLLMVALDAEGNMNGL